MSFLKKKKMVGWEYINISHDISFDVWKFGGFRLSNSLM